MSRNPHFRNLIVDNRYKELKVPLLPEEYQQLEDRLIAEKTCDPIIAWKRTIIDGYKRFEICIKNGIEPDTRSINFTCKEEAICWICKNEMKKKHLTDPYRKYYIGTYYYAKRDQFAKMYPTSPQAICAGLSQRPPIEREKYSRSYTSTVVSKEFGISQGAVYNYSVYARSIDILRTKAPGFAQLILSDTVHVSQKAVTELSRLSLPDLIKIREYMKRPSLTKFHSVDINRILDIKMTLPQTHSKDTGPIIKQLPKYDPDAEISSLTLTIPSWISSMTRTMNTAAFNNVTEEAKKKLNDQLWELQRSIITVQGKMKEMNTDE